MWKLYTRSSDSGSSSEFWDHSWDEAGAFVGGRENDRICENQGTVWRLLQAHLKKDRLFLEGGCGPANWLRYFHARGYRGLGVDFAPKTVERVKALDPTVDIRLGDVTAMPVADGSVHVYYSGGVVEHFETGPDPALREARRVLAPDGWFFCSVPDASTLRTNLVFRTSSTYAAAREVPDTSAEPVPDRMAFFQYAFSKDEFIRRLEAAGFRVEETLGYALLWGLMEIPGVAGLVRTSQRALRPGTNGNSAHESSSNGRPSSGAPHNGENGHPRPPAGGIKPRLRAAITRLLLQEDTSVPVAGSVLGLLLEHCSNLRMYVARPR